MAKTADEFYRTYVRKAIDADGGYGVQCVDGFRVFCNWAIGRSWPTGNGWADGYWYNRKQHADQFTEVDRNHLKDGDWVFWAKGSRSHPSSHVAMYYHGMSFGQNQHDARVGAGFSLHSTDFSDILGGLRWKGFGAAAKPQPKNPTIPSTAYAVFRLYNAHNGDHIFTASNKEANNLQNGGWQYEGIAWYHDDHGSPIYRLYNQRTGEHFLTASSNEKNTLVKNGWKYEGVAFGSGNGSPVYRLYNAKTGRHFYTISGNEKNTLVKKGWKLEGTAFYTRGQAKASTAAKPAAIPAAKAVKAAGIAKSFNKKIAKTYKTTANLNVRNEGNTKAKVLGVLPTGTTFQCFGYYTDDFYYGVATANGTTYTGFACKKYLRG